MGSRLSLLTVHAHPDDESSKGAGSVSLYASQGVHTTLVCCTGGEEGDILNPAMDLPEVRERIGDVRRDELATAAKIIGYDEVVMLGYRDSGMPDSEANANPAAFANAPLDEAVGRLVEVIRREQPQVVVTYGDDQQGYPHPDHLRVHDITLPAFDAAADAAAYPELGDPWQVSKLYYTMWSRARVLAMHEKFLELGLESPFDDNWFNRPSQEQRITTSMLVVGTPRRCPGRRAEGPRHPGRPDLAVLVRAPARGHARGASLRRLRAGPLARRQRHPRRRTSSPACAERRGQPLGAGFGTTLRVAFSPIASSVIVTVPGVSSTIVVRVVGMQDPRVEDRRLLDRARQPAVVGIDVLHEEHGALGHLGQDRS